MFLLESYRKQEGNAHQVECTAGRGGRAEQSRGEVRGERGEKMREKERNRLASLNNSLICSSIYQQKKINFAC